jgi:hypothetical protein
MQACVRTICGPTTITRQLREAKEPPCSTALTKEKTLSVPRAVISGGGTGRPTQLSLVTHAFQSEHSNIKKMRLRQPRMRDEEAGKPNVPHF